MPDLHLLCRAVKGRMTMRKAISVLLSVMLILGMLSCLAALPAAADGVSVGVTAAEGGYVLSATATAGSTVSARPYYGNTFKGWYLKGTDTKVSDSADYSGDFTGDLEARFNVYNQIPDGSFESGTTAGVDYFNLQSGSGKGRNNVLKDIPGGDSVIHGKKALYATVEGSNTSAYLLNTPLTVKKNTSYVLHFSYYLTDKYEDSKLSLGVKAEKSFTNAWTACGNFEKITVAWTSEGKNYPSWPGSARANGGNIIGQRINWNNNDADKVNTWADVWAYIDTGDDSTIFEDKSDTAKIWFDIGGHNNGNIEFYLDNVSFTEVSKTAPTAVTAVAEKNGKVVAAQKTPLSVVHVSVHGEFDKFADKTVEGTEAYSKAAITTYTAVADNGYEFEGWYDEKGIKVSSNATESFYTEGKYTAKYMVGALSGEGGYIKKNETASTVTAVPYYGNSFDGWYSGDRKLYSDFTITKANSLGLTAKFAINNQITDGAFDNGTVGLDYFNSYCGNKNINVITSTAGMSGNGIKMTVGGNCLMNTKPLVKIEKNKDYTLSFNMRINSLTSIDSNGKVQTPIFSVMVGGNKDGNTTWGNWPKLASWKITIRPVSDRTDDTYVTMSKGDNDIDVGVWDTKVYTYSGIDSVENHQISMNDIKNLCGDGWLEFTLEFNSGSDTTCSTCENIFEMDSPTVALAFGYNFARCDVDFDNIAFFENSDDVNFINKESVRATRVGIGPVSKGMDYSFALSKAEGKNATVTYDGKTVIPDTNGKYTVTLTDSRDITIICDGDENLPISGKDKNGNDLTKYDHTLYNTPVWDGDTVYHETVVFYEGRGAVKTLYPIDEIVSVRTYTLNDYFVEGVDFAVRDGKLVRLEGSSIKTYGTPTTTDGVWESDDEGIYVTQYSGGSLYTVAVDVTYKHSKTWKDLGEEGYSGKKQETVDGQLTVFEKLKNGKDVHIVFYGDSMTSGWSISGGKTDVYTDKNDGTTTESGLYTAPFAPNWMTMFIDGLKKEYPTAKITWENLSLGGKDSNWGKNNFEARFKLLKNTNVDLLLLGWGINDNGAGVTAATFKSNEQAIINAFKAKCPTASVLLYGANSTNPYAKIYDTETLLAYEAAHRELALENTNTAATSLTSIFVDIAKSKETADLFENNYNHANDFGCRIYSQVMISALSKCVNHVYDGPCDSDCNICHEERKTSGHTYDNDLDAVCNDCNNVRYSNAWVTVDGNRYYFDKKGVMQTGWLYLDRTYYYLGTDGVMETGWLCLGGVWYYLDTDGKMLTNWQGIGGSWYYFNAGGSMVTNTWFGNFWLNASGKMAVNSWVYYNDAYYYVGADGAYQTGWLYLGGAYYYLNAAGVMQTGWQYIGGAYYYLTSGGSMAANTWVGNFWLDASGKMAVNTWVYYNGAYYYVGADGAYQTGWIYVSGAYYYLNAGGVMQTGWQYISGNWYYFYSGGSMATNCYIGNNRITASGAMA